MPSASKWWRLEGLNTTLYKMKAMTALASVLAVITLLLQTKSGSAQVFQSSEEGRVFVQSDREHDCRRRYLSNALGDCTNGFSESLESCYDQKQTSSIQEVQHCIETVTRVYRNMCVHGLHSNKYSSCVSQARKFSR